MSQNKNTGIKELEDIINSSQGKFRRSPSEEALLSYMNARVPVMLVSDPGMGKTATIRSIAKEIGYDLETLIASRMDAQDVSGFPTKGEVPARDNDGNIIVDKNGEIVFSPVTEFAPQMWQKNIIEKKTVILFFDEFSNAHPSVRASLLSLFQDRQFPNGEHFPEETIIVGAMNPTDSAADGYDLDEATTNRIAFIAWKPDYRSWLIGMKNSWGNECSPQEQEWRDLIYRFISENPGALHRQNSKDIGTGEVYNINTSDPSENAVAQYAWASRRSWDNLAVALGNSTVKSSYVEDIIIGGLIGKQTATQFRKWLDENSRLDVKKILANPRGYKGWKDLSANDVTTILSTGFDGLTKDNIYNLLETFEIINEIDKASLAASYINDLTKCHHPLKDQVPPEEFEKMKKSIISTLVKYQKITKNS